MVYIYRYKKMHGCLCITDNRKGPIYIEELNILYKHLLGTNEGCLLGWGKNILL